MEIFLIFFCCWLLGRGVVALCKPRRPRAKAQRNPGNRSSGMAALTALQAQRDELNEQLYTVSASLDQAPPEAMRLRLMKERTRIYGQLAQVETKISRLIG